MWSKYQQAIFEFARSGAGNGAGIAVAGAGKTTTAVEMVQQFSFMDQGLFTSMTNVIVNELQKRIREKNLPNIRAKTYNSFGAGLIYRNMRPAPTLLNEREYHKTDEVLRYDVLRNGDEPLYKRCRSSVYRLVDLFKSLAILTREEAEERFGDIVDYYDVDLPDEPLLKPLVCDTYEASLRRTDVIDFNDQKLFPILFGWHVPQVDFLVIDEYQDTCPVESRLMLSACRHGRVIIFGDPNQAIYSFKGTSPDTIDEFVRSHSATRLPLSICYRCPRAVVDEARTIVPEIEAAPDAAQGYVRTIKRAAMMAKVTDRDLVLARTTEDLVKSVTALLGEGRAAFVRGKEYAAQLGYFIAKFQVEPTIGIDQFMGLVNAHYNELHPELIRHQKENRAIQLESKVNTLSVLAVGCQTLRDLNNKIDRTFTNDGSGIEHMTGHKAKGLESHRDGDVYVLRPDKIPHPRARKDHAVAEEMRLKYVMITRARRGLNWVEKERDER